MNPLGLRDANARDWMTSPGLARVALWEFAAPPGGLLDTMHVPSEETMAGIEIVRTEAVESVGATEGWYAKDLPRRGNVGKRKGGCL